MFVAGKSRTIKPLLLVSIFAVYFLLLFPFFTKVSFLNNYFFAKAWTCGECVQNSYYKKCGYAGVSYLLGKAYCGQDSSTHDFCLRWFEGLDQNCKTGGLQQVCTTAQCFPTGCVEQIPGPRPATKQRPSTDGFCQSIPPSGPYNPNAECVFTAWSSSWSPVYVCPSTDSSALCIDNRFRQVTHYSAVSCSQTNFSNGESRARCVYANSKTFIQDCGGDGTWVQTDQYQCNGDKLERKSEMRRCNVGTCQSFEKWDEVQDCANLPGDKYRCSPSDNHWIQENQSFCDAALSVPQCVDNWVDDAYCGDDYYEYQCVGDTREKRLIQQGCTSATSPVSCHPPIVGPWEEDKPCGTDYTEKRCTSNNDFIYIYYGSHSLPGSFNEQNVYDANYQGVWHLNDSKDSTANGNNGTFFGTKAVSGIAGAARNFPSGDYMEISSSLSSLIENNITLEAWVKGSSNSLSFTNALSPNVAVPDGMSKWNFKATVFGQGSYTDINKVIIRLADSADSVFPFTHLEFTWNQAAGSFQETGSDGAGGYATIADDSFWSCNGNSCILDFKIIFNPAFLAKDTHYNASLVVVSDSGETYNSFYLNIYQVSDNIFVTPSGPEAASSEAPFREAKDAHDKNNLTVWASAAKVPQWIWFDLQEEKFLSGVRVLYPSTFYLGDQILDIQVSNDASSWTTVVSNWRINKISWNEIAFPVVKARYFRLYFTDSEHSGALAGYVTVSETQARIAVGGFSSPPAAIGWKKGIMSELESDGAVKFEAYLDSGSNSLGAGFYNGEWKVASDDSLFIGNEWIYLAASYDGERIRFYRNGEQKAESLLNIPLPPGLDSWRIGANHNPGDISGFFDGIIDEVKVSNKARAGAWLSFSYLSDKGDAVSISGEEEVTPGVFRFKANIINNNVSDTLDDFPLHIDLSKAPQHFWDNVKNNGSDIRIIDKDTKTDLTSQAHLEEWNKAGKRGDLWLKRTIQPYNALGNYVQERLVEQGCDTGTNDCFITLNPWNNISGCGADEQTGWSDDYCKARSDGSGEDVYHQTVFHNKGCLSQSCYDEQEIDEELVRSCTAGCASANCKPWLTGVVISGEDYCSLSPKGSVAIEWEYNDDEGNPQAQYTVQADTDPTFSSPAEYTALSQSNTARIDVAVSPGPSEISYGGHYFWQVKVKDSFGNESDWYEGPEFDSPDNPYPYVDWDYSPTPVNIGEIISTINSSECYDSFGNIVECKSYRWSVDPSGASFDYASGNQASFQPQFIFNEKKQYTVTLTVKDDANQVCAKWQPINAGYPLPTWKEIKPF